VNFDGKSVCWTPFSACDSNSVQICAIKALNLLPWEHGKILGRPEMGWGKVACWSTKVAISLKCVKIDEKLVWSTHRNSPTLF